MSATARTSHRRLFAAAVLAVVAMAVAACGSDLPVPPGDGGAPGDTGQLVGVWEGAYQHPTYGRAQVQTVLQASGSFSQTTVYPDAGQQFSMSGTYEVMPGSLIRFTIEDYQPRQFCGPLGCNAISVGTGETVAYSFVDRDTLRTDSQSCDGPGCEVTHTRAG